MKINYQNTVKAKSARIESPLVRDGMENPMQIFKQLNRNSENYGDSSHPRINGLSFKPMLPMHISATLNSEKASICSWYNFFGANRGGKTKRFIPVKGKYIAVMRCMDERQKALAGLNHLPIYQKTENMSLKGVPSTFRRLPAVLIAYIKKNF